MKKLYSHFILCLVLFAGLFYKAQGQVNLAPQAVVNSNNCFGNTCDFINNQDTGACGTPQVDFMYVVDSNSIGNSGIFIEWEWSNPVTINAFVIYWSRLLAGSTSPVFSSAMLQYWTGSSWQNHFEITRLGSNCADTAHFPTITAQKIRLIDFKGFFHDPGMFPIYSQLTTAFSLREIEIISAPFAQNDGGIYKIISPSLNSRFCQGSNNVVVQAANFGTNIINNLTIHWEVNGIAQPSVNLNTPLDTLNGSNPWFADVSLGNFNITGGTTYHLKVWTSSPNGQPDTINYNDTISYQVRASLGGAYTIDASQPTSGTNFQSFNHFRDALDSLGVCGAVTVNVVPGSGPYDEQVIFEYVNGISATNNVTINGNGNILRFSPTGTNQYILRFSQAEHFTIDSLHIENNSTSSSTCVSFFNAAHNINIQNCTISNAGSGFTMFFHTFSNSHINQRNLSDIRLEKNHIFGGGRGISSDLSSITHLSNISIIENSINDFWYFGINLRNVNNLLISGNDIQRSSLNTNFVFNGLNISGTSGSTRVINNRIHNNVGGNPNNSQLATFASLGGTINNPHFENIFANNILYGFGGTGNKTAIQVNSQANWHIYHNTVVLNSPNSTAGREVRIIHCEPQTLGKIKNNLFVLGNSGALNPVFISSSALPNPAVFNNNVYFSTDSSVSFSNIPAASDFSSWQAQGFDTNSTFTNPDFIGGTGVNAFQPQNNMINRTGTNVLAYVPTDIEGAARGLNPTPGAYQLPHPPGTDVAISKFLLDSIYCPGTKPIKVVVGNVGGDTLNQFIVSWKVNTVVQTPVTVTGNFPPNWVDTITLGSISISANTFYDFEAEVIIANDVDTTNNYVMHLGSRPALSGTYTINQTGTASGTLFTSFETAIEALSNYGVCGPVTFNVTPGSGPYNEQVSFSHFKGNSATNTLTLNGNNNQLQFHANNINSRHTFMLDSVQYVTVNGLNISCLNTSSSGFGWGIQITGSAKDIIIQNCSISTHALFGSDRYYGIIIHNEADRCTLNNNTVNGGSRAITISSGLAHTVSGNTVMGFSDVGIQTNATDNISIKNNEVIFNLNSIEPCSGIHIGSGSNNPNARIIVEQNLIYSNCSNCTSSPQTLAGISSTDNNSLRFILEIINNKIVNLYGREAVGIRASQFKSIIHNTISITNPTPGGAPTILRAVGLSAFSISGLNAYRLNGRVENNIFYLNRSVGTNIIYRGFTLNLVSDHNSFYSRDSIINHSAAGNTYGFNNWQSSTGKDANSVFEDPLFVDPALGDFTPTRAAIYRIGKDWLSLAPNDFFGAPRTSTPSPGAIEFTPPPCSGPYQFRLDSIQDTTGVFSWSSQASKWAVQYGTQGFNPNLNQGTIDSASTRNGYILHGLSPNTCYDFYVADVCAGDTSLWTGPISHCTKYGRDAEFLRFLSPVNRDCGDAITPISVEIKNNGAQNITSADVHVEVTGAQTIMLQSTFSGNIRYGDSAVFHVGNLNLIAGGVFHIKAWVHIANDENHFNDTLYFNDLLIVPQNPQFGNLPFCQGDDSLTVFGVNIPGSMGYEWYDQATGGNLLSSNDTLKIPASALPNVWLANKPFSFPQSVQPACVPNIARICPSSNTIFINSFSTSGGLTSNISNLNSGCSPTSYSDFTQQFTDALPGDTIFFDINISQANGRIHLYIDWDNNGIFSGPEENVIPSIVSPINSSHFFVVPANASPGEKRLRIMATNNSTLANFSPCLFPLGEAEDYIIIVRGGQPCTGNRTQINLSADSILTASFSVNQLPGREIELINTSTPFGSIATWNIGNLTVTTGDTVRFIFPQNGTYPICLFAQNACSADTLCESINVCGVNVERFSLTNVKLYPNPNRGQFTLEFNLLETAEMRVEVFSMEGKCVYSETHQNFQGAYFNAFDFQHLSSGMYFLRITSGRESIKKKMIIGK